MEHVTKDLDSDLISTFSAFSATVLTLKTTISQCTSLWVLCVCFFDFNFFIIIIHTLRVHYAHAAANLNSGYSKYVKIVHVHYFCTIALRTYRAVLT